MSTQSLAGRPFFHDFAEPPYSPLATASRHLPPPSQGGRADALRRRRYKNVASGSRVSAHHRKKPHLSYPGGVQELAVAPLRGALWGKLLLNRWCRFAQPPATFLKRLRRKDVRPGAAKLKGVDRRRALLPGASKAERGPVAIAVFFRSGSA